MNKQTLLKALEKAESLLGEADCDSENLIRDGISFDANDLTIQTDVSGNTVSFEIDLGNGGFDIDEAVSNIDSIMEDVLKAKEIIENLISDLEEDEDAPKRTISIITVQHLDGSIETFKEF